MNDSLSRTRYSHPFQLTYHWKFSIEPFNPQELQSNGFQFRHEKKIIMIFIYRNILFFNPGQLYGIKQQGNIF